MPSCGKVAFLLLLLTCLCAQPGSGQQAGQAETGTRKPFFERLRRLEEQFRWFQELTLTRLQGIADNYNISYNIEERFQLLTDQYANISQTIGSFHASATRDLDSLKLWTKKLQKKNKKLELKVSALEKALNEKSKQTLRDNKERDGVLSSLTQELRDQKDQISSLSSDRDQVRAGLQGLQDALRSQEAKVERFEQQVSSALQSEALSSSEPSAQRSSNQTPEGKATETPDTDGEQQQQQRSGKKLQVKHFKGRQLQERQTPGTPALRPKTAKETQVNQPLQQTQGLPPPVQRHKIPWQQQQQEQPPKKPGTICNVKSMLVFPNASTENYVTFTKGFPAELHELSVCTWLRTEAGYLGTLLSYATEENDNKLVLHGRNSSAPQTSLHFVIGDPAFRELPVGPLLHRGWHHLCVIWSSIEGKYWYYVNRRLSAAGSKFQKGYEIPPGGSLVLGQEQDSVGGGFDMAESFVGSLAGFAAWNRALTPGEVSGIATGKGMPRGTVFTLDDIAAVHGDVQRVDCGCLEHCV
ncbi:pentraxin-4 [Polyodon spathula]|uniref:pentraxin-4 n=1 Tax=Polyodon spathula TaxID=7913 RepID=UPI001B7F0320|nr:pentraxin-4 [Polyodon spathula]